MASDRLIPCRRWLAVSAATVLISFGLFVSLATSALAATTIGLAAPASACGNGYGQVQDAGGSPPAYTVPFDGVITSFSAASNLASTQVKLLVMEPPASGTTYNVVAKSDAGTFTTVGVQTFATNIPVRAGEVIGDWGYVCSIDSTGNPADVFNAFNGPEPALGPTGFPDVVSSQRRIDLSATVEPAPAVGSTGQRAAALKKCKKKHSKKARKKCRKKAQLLPV